MQESSRINGYKVAVIASGGNIDREVYAAVLNGETFAAK
jgi:threonine dehydratase